MTLPSRCNFPSTSPNTTKNIPVRQTSQKIFAPSFHPLSCTTRKLVLLQHLVSSFQTDTTNSESMPKLTKGKINPDVEALTAKFKSDGLSLFKKELPKRIKHLTEKLETEDFKVIKIDDFVLAQDVVAKLDKILANGGDMMNRSRKRKADSISDSQAAAAKNNAGAAPTASGGGAKDSSKNGSGGGSVGSLPSNPRILRMMRVLKVEYTDALDIAATLKMWIQLNVPRIEDGNNFGVDVQNECINELSQLEDKCCGLLETTTKYFSGRAKLLSKCIKYPDIEDYRKSIEEVDHST